jgi:hypothetical protein
MCIYWRHSKPALNVQESEKCICSLAVLNYNLSQDTQGNHLRIHSTYKFSPALVIYIIFTDGELKITPLLIIQYMEFTLIILLYQGGLIVQD